MGPAFPDDRRKSLRRYRDDLGIDLDALPGAEVADVSLDGVGVRSPHPLKPGETVRVKLHLPTGSSVSGRGVVRWCAEEHMGFRTGIQLERLGWLARRRLRACLESPDAEPGRTWTELFDQALLVLTLAVGFLIACDVMGVKLATPGELLDFAARF